MIGEKHQDGQKSRIIQLLKERIKKLWWNLGKQEMISQIFEYE
jgi:hypothetical protein